MLTDRSLLKFAKMQMLMDKRTKNRQKLDKQTDRIAQILERHLAMMVIYLPVKFKFDWTKRF